MIAHLADFAEILQVDGYGGFRVLTEKGGNTIVLLAKCASALLRTRDGGPLPDRQRGAQADR